MEEERLRIQPSILCFIFRLSFYLSLMCMILISTLPLIISIYSLLLVWNEASLHPAEKQKEIILFNSSRFHYMNLNDQLRTTSTFLLGLGVLIKGDKQLIWLWHDSFQEEDYRRLLRWLHLFR